MSGLTENQRSLCDHFSVARHINEGELLWRSYQYLINSPLSSFMFMVDCDQRLARQSTGRVTLDWPIRIPWPVKCRYAEKPVQSHFLFWRSQSWPFISHKVTSLRLLLRSDDLAKKRKCCCESWEVADRYAAAKGRELRSSDFDSQHSSYSHFSGDASTFPSFLMGVSYKVRERGIKDE